MNANRQGELDFLTITVIVIHDLKKKKLDNSKEEV